MFYSVAISCRIAAVTGHPDAERGRRIDEQDRIKEMELEGTKEESGRNQGGTREDQGVTRWNKEKQEEPNGESGRKQGENKGETEKGVERKSMLNSKE